MGPLYIYYPYKTDTKSLTISISRVLDGLIDRQKNFSSNLFQAHGLYVKDLRHAIRIRFTWYGLIGLGSESIRQIFIIYF
jgi:hypothetical protein